jgi:hypothetical protein
MKDVPVEKSQHNCINCAASLHGGLCGYEFPVGLSVGIDVPAFVSKLSRHGQDVVSQNRNDSIICFIFYNSATMPHKSKSPFKVLSDDEPEMVDDPNVSQELGLVNMCLQCHHF